MVTLTSVVYHPLFPAVPAVTAALVTGAITSIFDAGEVQFFVFPALSLI
jgi:hypothetical protein